jgi:hypothetical protein
MRKISIIFLLVVMAFMTSCGVVNVIPRATNTVKPVTLNELNLSNSDYSVLNTISEYAVVSVTYYPNKNIEVRDAENTFAYVLAPIGKKKSDYIITKHEGVIRAGYLSNDYGEIDMKDPENVARRVAIYRLINTSQALGADGLIEPVISTNIEGLPSLMGGVMTVTYRTTVSAKPVKLKVTGK